MGLYMVNERSGKLGEPVHPFGPGGEGGRDDAIYSSPANLQVKEWRGGGIFIAQSLRSMVFMAWQCPYFTSMHPIAGSKINTL